MKTVLITKDDVLTAIETEPFLGGGTFYSCVVGATLRQAGITDPFLVVRVARHVTEGKAASHHRALVNNWLSALSVVWEYLNVKNRPTSPEDLRWNIWEWAEENIPEDWEYELVVNGGVA